MKKLFIFCFFSFFIFSGSVSSLEVEKPTLYFDANFIMNSFESKLDNQTLSSDVQLQINDYIIKKCNELDYYCFSYFSLNEDPRLIFQIYKDRNVNWNYFYKKGTSSTSVGLNSNYYTNGEYLYINMSYFGSSCNTFECIKETVDYRINNWTSTVYSTSNGYLNNSASSNPSISKFENKIYKVGEDINSGQIIYDSNINRAYFDVDFKITYDNQTLSSELLSIKKALDIYSKPIITFERHEESIDSDNKVHALVLKTKFSVVDLKKYDYYISVDNGENFILLNDSETLINDNFVYRLFYKNTSVIAKVVDKNTDRPVVAQTYSISSIDNSNLKITYSHLEDLDEYIELDGKSYQDSFNLRTQFSYIDSRYFRYRCWHYEIDFTDYMIDYDKGYYDYIFRNNGTMICSYVGLDDKPILSQSFSVSSLKDREELGQSISFNEYCDYDYCNIDSIYPNFDSSKYNYYISIDNKKTWLNITTKVGYKTYRQVVYENMILYYKITDKQGNTILNRQYEVKNIGVIDWSQYKTPGDFLRLLQRFLNRLDDTSIYFNQVFDMFFQSLPFMFQFLMISLWIVFLIFFAFRLGGWE